MEDSLIASPGKVLPVKSQLKLFQERVTPKETPALLKANPSHTTDALEENPTIKTRLSFRNKSASTSLMNETDNDMTYANLSNLINNESDVSLYNKDAVNIRATFRNRKTKVGSSAPTKTYENVSLSGNKTYDIGSVMFDISDDSFNLTAAKEEIKTKRKRKENDVENHELDIAEEFQSQIGRPDKVQKSMLPGDESYEGNSDTTDDSINLTAVKEKIQNMRKRNQEALKDPNIDVEGEFVNQSRKSMKKRKSKSLASGEESQVSGSKLTVSYANISEADITNSSSFIENFNKANSKDIKSKFRSKSVNINFGLDSVISGMVPSKKSLPFAERTVEIPQRNEEENESPTRPTNVESPKSSKSKKRLEGIEERSAALTESLNSSLEKRALTNSPRGSPRKAFITRSLSRSEVVANLFQSPNESSVKTAASPNTKSLRSPTKLTAIIEARSSDESLLQERLEKTRDISLARRQRSTSKSPVKKTNNLILSQSLSNTASNKQEKTPIQVISNNLTDSLRRSSRNSVHNSLMESPNSKTSSIRKSLTFTQQTSPSQDLFTDIQKLTPERSAKPQKETPQKSPSRSQKSSPHNFPSKSQKSSPRKSPAESQKSLPHKSPSKFQKSSPKKSPSLVVRVSKLSRNKSLLDESHETSPEVLATDDISQAGRDLLGKTMVIGGVSASIMEESSDKIIDEEVKSRFHRPRKSIAFNIDDIIVNMQKDKAHEHTTGVGNDQDNETENLNVSPYHSITYQSPAKVSVLESPRKDETSISQGSTEASDKESPLMSPQKHSTETERRLLRSSTTYLENKSPMNSSKKSPTQSGDRFSQRSSKFPRKSLSASEEKLHKSSVKSPEKESPLKSIRKSPRKSESKLLQSFAKSHKINSPMKGVRTLSPSFEKSPDIENSVNSSQKSQRGGKKELLQGSVRENVTATNLKSFLNITEISKEAFQEERMELLQNNSDKNSEASGNFSPDNKVTSPLSSQGNTIKKSFHRSVRDASFSSNEPSKISGISREKNLTISPSPMSVMSNGRSSSPTKGHSIRDKNDSISSKSFNLKTSSKKNISKSNISIESTHNTKGERNRIASKQLTLVEFLEKLSKGKDTPRKETNHIQSLLSKRHVPELPSKDVTARPQTPKKEEKKSKSTKVTNFPFKMNRNTLQHFCKHKVSPEGAKVFHEAMEIFFDNLSSDLDVIMTSKQDKMINKDHIYLLLKELGLVSSWKGLHAMMQDFLPVELWEKVVPTQFAFNKVLPKK